MVGYFLGYSDRNKEGSFDWMIAKSKRKLVSIPTIAHGLDLLHKRRQGHDAAAVTRRDALGRALGAALGASIVFQAGVSLAPPEAHARKPGVNRPVRSTI